MQTSGMEWEHAGKRELFEVASKLSPQFQSLGEARSYFSSQLELIAQEHALTVEALVARAHASETNDDLTRTVLGLVRNLYLLKQK
jgi:hypothetical protein